jgi:hypothetical protein
MRKYFKMFLFLSFFIQITILPVFASSIPDEREFLTKNLKMIELRIVKYIVGNPGKFKDMFLNVFKPYYRNNASFQTVSEYDAAIAKTTLEYNKNVNVETWDGFNKSEFEKIAQQFFLAKLYVGKYNRVYYLYSKNYHNRQYSGTLDYLERMIYNSYQTARSLIQNMSTKLYELEVLLRNNAIYSIRRSYALDQDGRKRFEQHALGDVFKMLNVYKGKFSDFRAGVMINLAKFQVRESASNNNGFAIILNFAPIKKQIRIDKIKMVTLTVSASSGLELIKELFNTASENMVTLATIERLQASVTTRQWKMAQIKMQDIVASKAFVLGFKVLKTEKFERTERGRKVKYLKVTVTAKIGLPKLSDIVFAREASHRLKTFKKMIKQNREQAPAVNSPAVTGNSSGNTAVPTPSVAPQRGNGGTAANTNSGNANVSPENTPSSREGWGASSASQARGHRRPSHPDNDNDLPDVQRRDRFYTPESPQEDAWQRTGQ